MEKQNKPKKNHWTQSKVDEWAKKINQEIYKRNRQAPIHLKMDDLAILKDMCCSKHISFFGV